MQPQFSDIETRHRLARRFVFTNVNSPDKIIDLEAGKGHNQADASSFILHAEGQVLALDAGYLK